MTPELDEFKASLWNRLSLRFHQDPTSGHAPYGPRGCWQCETAHAAGVSAFISALTRARRRAVSA